MSGHSKLAAGQIATDALSAMLALALAYWLRFHVYPKHPPGGEPPDLNHYVAAAPVVALCVLAVFALTGVYRYRRGVQFIDELFEVMGAMVVVAVVVLALIGIYREAHFTYSRLTYVYWWVLAALLISVTRYLIRREQVRRRARGVGVDRTVVVGQGASAGLLIQRMRMFPDYGYQLLGVLSDALDPGTEFAGVQVLGPAGQLPGVIAEHRVNVVFLALPEVSQDAVLELMESCRDTQADFRIVPSMLELMTTQVTADQLDGIPLLQLRRGLDIDEPKVALKRAFDLVAGGLALLVLSPLLALVALVVRVTSPGPVLLRQERVGIGGRAFEMLKFRTMQADAEAESGPIWASPDDPRRTPVGGFLRQLSVDELPQLINVVRGEMSLVGPRPERPVFVREFSGRLSRYQDRHHVHPGLTGWAQVNDLRGHTPVEERLIYDLYYIENWSLAFDLKIILITLFRVFLHKNAY
ncbi:MAG: undecaprenyl-phosphate glucose phosphotransferase [Candidatus Dormibacterales bacterium]